VYRVANDRDYTPQFISESVAQITGYTQSEYLVERSISCGAEVHPEDKDSVWQIVQQAVAAHAPYECEYRIHTKSGEVKWVWERGRGIFSPTGELEFLEGFVTDITERKQAEALKEANEERLRAIINASPVPKALNDEHQNIIFLNPAFTQTFGYTREDIPTLADWWPKAYPDPEYRRWVAETWQATLDKCQREGTAFPPMELDVRCQNGTVKTVLASADPIGKSFEGAHLVVLYDITERKHAEAERERLLAELTARNIEMESFVYTISHDLKSPLITIGGFASLLEKDLARHDGAAAADSIAEIKKAARDMQLLIENLLQLARLGQITGEPREVDVNALLEELRARCARHFEQEHATVRIAPDIPWLRVDPVRLGEVLQNLVENALKYHRPGVPPEIEIGWRHEGGWLRLYVRDNGIGIKKEYQKRIFGLFQRLDSHAEGTGVGLTISRRIIEYFGGRLSVESEPGEGCTFWIELPESVMVRKDSRVSDKDVNLRS
jgi:PAS domain S-box-containing protein